MSWWGKLAGGAFGFMLGGPLGALAGAAFGHSFDRGLEAAARGLPGPGGATPQERTQAAFFAATFGVMGHIAKADGQVSREEIQLARAVMDQLGLSGELKQAAQRLFDEGKRDDFPLDEALFQLRRECRRATNIIRMFVEIQVHAAYADGEVHPAERRILDHIAEVLGVSAIELKHLEAMISTQSAWTRSGGSVTGLPLEDAYAVLDMTPANSDAEVKRAYRRLMSQHHPDKLVAKGLPEEMMRAATQRTQEIKAAYERVKEARNV